MQQGSTFGRLALVVVVAATALAAAGAAGAAGSTAPDQATSLPPPQTSVPPSTPTSILPPPVTSVPTTLPGLGEVCRFVQRFGRVPPQAIADAMANPGSVYGFMVPCNPSVPSSLYNRPRVFLSLHAINKPYHPLWNPLEYKCGCP